MSWAWRRALIPGILLSAFLGPIAAPNGVAQGGGQPHFDMQSSVDRVQAVIHQEDGSVEFQVNITIRAARNLPTNGDFRVDITARTDSRVPNGWGLTPRVVTFANEDAPKPNPSASVSFTFRVYLILPRPEADEFRITWDIVAKPRWTGSTDPISLAIASQFSAEDRESETVTVTRNLTTTEAVTAFVKGYKWWLLAAAGGIFVLGIALVRRHDGTITATSDSQQQEVLPGRGASFPVRIANDGNHKVSITLSASEVPEGWQAILPVQRLELQANESTTLWLTLKSPSHAQPGEHVQLGFVASTSEGATSEVTLEAVVVERFGQSPPPPTESPPPEPEPEPPEARPRRRTSSRH